MSLDRLKTYDLHKIGQIDKYDLDFKYETWYILRCITDINLKILTGILYYY